VGPSHLPANAPQSNPIEGVWWHVHEEITGNTPCVTIEELLDLVFGWLEAGSRFGIETSSYPKATTIRPAAA
jgi:hypothetical protein